MEAVDLLRSLARYGIQDRRVLEAMRRVPRDLFCLPEHRPLAWADVVLPLAAGASLSQPRVVAAMLHALHLEGRERVLEIGSGSGYTTALLCELAAMVYGIEIEPRLAVQADARLRRIGYANFELVCGDGRIGHPERAPFDAILLHAAASSPPPELVVQLAPGGHLVGPFGDEEHQTLRVYRSLEEGAVLVQDLGPVRFFPLR